MAKIKAYELNIKGQFCNELTVEEITVFTTKEEANRECETILARLNKKHNGIYKAKLIMYINMTGLTLVKKTQNGMEI